jgi:hypothetical protein
VSDKGELRDGSRIEDGELDAERERVARRAVDQALADRNALVSQLRRVRRWLLAAQAQATGGRRSTIDGQIREVDETLRGHGGPL